MTTTPRISLKDYIISHNYRKQVESHSKNKYKSHHSKMSVIDTQGTHKLINESTLAHKVEQIKCYARQIIKQDILFVKMQSMLTQLLRMFVQQINMQRNNNNVINEILKMSLQKTTKSRCNTPSQNQSIKNNFLSFLDLSKNIQEKQTNKISQNSIEEKIESANQIIDSSRIKNKMEQTKVVQPKRQRFKTEAEKQKHQYSFGDEISDKQVKQKHKQKISLSSVAYRREQNHSLINRPQINKIDYAKPQRTTSISQKKQENNNHTKNIDEMVKNLKNATQITNKSNKLQGRTVAQIRQKFK